MYKLKPARLASFFSVTRRRQSTFCNSQTLTTKMEIVESSAREDEGLYLSIPRGGPIYVPNLVGPLTRVPDFESSVFHELQSLTELLGSDSSQPCDYDEDDLDISVDELKIFSEEELVDMAMKEAFKEEDDDQQLLECSQKQSDTRNDPGRSSNGHVCLENSGREGDASVPLESSNVSPPETSLENLGRGGGALVPVESSNGTPDNGCSEVPSIQKSKKRKKTKHADEDGYIAKVGQLAKIKRKQDEEKATVKLHSFNATCKTNYCAISSSEKTERMTSLRSTNTAIKVKASSSLNEHISVPYPEVLLCIEVYHSRKTWLKTQEFLVLGKQSLTELRDGIYCSTDQVMQKANQHDPSGYFLIEDVFYNDMRDSSAIDYSEPILDWLRDCKEDALKKWECITTGELQKKQKAIIGDITDSHLPRFKALHMHKTRFCDLRFRLGAGYLYCHQGDCKHTIVIRDMRLIHAEDVNNRAAYPILIFQIKLRLLKCYVCKIARAEKVTVDDKWAPENPCYFCKNCYFLLHYSMDGSLLYSDFSVYDYNHD